MRHLFEYPWTFSYKPRIVYKQQQTERDWLLDYKTIAVIKDVETFWGVYNNIPSLIDMPAGSIYAMFKNGINPSWEDPENKTGFSWILYGSKNATKAWIHQVYESILLMLIGCQYKYEEYLNGCSFERKAKGDKFVFWFKTKNNELNWALKDKTESLELQKSESHEHQRSELQNNENESLELNENESLGDENELLTELLNEIGVNPEDYVIGDEEMKIDWKSPEYKHKKVCIKLVQHSVSTAIKTSTKPLLNKPQSNKPQSNKSLTNKSQSNYHQFNKSQSTKPTSNHYQSNHSQTNHHQSNKPQSNKPYNFQYNRMNRETKNNK